MVARLPPPTSKRVSENPQQFRYPQRIVCLTEEPTEVLYLLGEEARIVGISGFTVRPPRARKAHPKVSAFISAKTPEILALEPDLVIGFSDLQADIAATLIRAGVEVWISNHRSVEGILGYIARLGAMVGAVEKTALLLAQLDVHLQAVRLAAAEFPRRPKVYFEEWDTPPMSAIRWVAELVRIAGGDDIFPELALEPLGRKRIIADPKVIIDRQPDIILGSWCGKKFRPEQVRAREGFSAIPAVRHNELHEIKSPIILQPGPAALFDGLSAMHAIFKRFAYAPTESRLALDSP